jgi:hypothetical protein
MVACQREICQWAAAIRGLICGSGILPLHARIERYVRAINAKHDAAFAWTASY